MKESKNEQNRKIKIIQGKGNEWSEAGNAIMQIFSNWLDTSDIKNTEFLARVNDDTFSISYRHEPDEAEIRLTDSNGTIGMTFPWNSKGSISFEHYMTDAMLLLFHIRSLCYNKKSIKTINDFLCKNVTF